MKIVLLGVVGCLIGCGDNLTGTLRADARRSDSSVAVDSRVDGRVDARPADASVDAAPAVGPWGTPAIITLSPPPSMGIDNHPSMTSDLLELYFSRTSDIYVAKRANVNAAWGAPALIAEVSSASFETGPQITSDGLALYFASDRPGGLGGLDIYLATRATRANPFGTPVAVTELNSAADDSSPAPTSDQLTIVQSSTRASAGNVDIYVATRASTSVPWGPSLPITEVNSVASDNNPMLFDGQLTLYWDVTVGTNRDIYQATRATTTAPFGMITAVAELDTASVEAAAWVSPDAHHVVWLSNRSGTFAFYEAAR